MVNITSNISEEVIFVIKSNQEYNTKLLLIMILLIYAVLFIIFHKRLLNIDKNWSDMVAYFGLWYGWVTVVFAPFLFIMLYLEVSLDKMFVYVGGFYSIMLVIAFLTAKMWFFEIIVKLLNKTGFAIKENSIRWNRGGKKKW